MSLAERKCQACGPGTPVLERARAEALARELRDFRITADGKALRADYAMQGFVEAVELVNAVRDVAEAEDHHPDVHLTGYRKLAFELSTHSIGGLSENDFILAAKIEALPKKLKT